MLPSSLPPTMPPPPLPDDLLEEIFLRLPPDEPACLVRASLASKLWLGLLTGPRFSARYRDFHEAPPMLGFCPMDSYIFPPEEGVFCPMDQEVPVDRYFSTTKFGARVPDDKGWGNISYSVRDCRHGRVLLDDGPSAESLTLVVWDPMTGCRREMPTSKNYDSHAAAVLCTVAGCHHRACHEGPSLVVSVGMETFVWDDYGDFFARMWSSETSEWTEPCYAPALPSYALIDEKPPVLIRDALHFLIRYPQEKQNGFLIYELGSSTLSVLDAPPLPEFVVYNSGYIHMAMEDGTLGFAYVDIFFDLCLWSRHTGSDAVEPWTQHKVIHLDKLLPIQNPGERLGLVGSVEGNDIIFVGTDLDIYEIDLKSLRWKELCKRDRFLTLIPYMSFYHPTERAMLP